MKKAKPIIDQVFEVLVEDIRGEKYQDNPRLPSEKKLAEQLGVSRTTIRTALARLEAEGLVTRRQGDGTFVNQHAMERGIRLGGKWEFNYLIESSGRKIRIECLKLAVEEQIPSVNKSLELDKDGRVIVLERIFYGDDKPLIHSINTFPYTLYQAIDDVEEMDFTLPLHDLIYRYFKEKISYSVSDIKAVLSKPEHQESLQIKPGTPIFEFQDVFYNSREIPLVAGHNFLNDKIFRLQVAQSWG